MKQDSDNQSGFTAVELLITLFIAAIFLFAGYQLYTQVSKEGAIADKSARISNMVYDKMRVKAGALADSGPCTSPTPTNEAVPVTGISNVSLNTTITCPFGSANDISLLTLTATYNDGISTNTLVHAIYVK